MIYLLIGPAGSGKSTWISNNRQSNSIVLSSDELRGLIGKDENDQSVTPQTFKTLQNIYSKLLEVAHLDFDIYIDATNLNRKERKFYIDQANRYNLAVTAVVLELPLHVLIERNVKRGADGGRNVPVAVLDRMINKYEAPTVEEGFKYVKYV